MSEDFLKEKFNQTKEELQDHENRIRNLEETYSILQNMDNRIEGLEDSMKKINDKLDDQNKNKVKKWDKLIDYLFYFVIGTILTFIAVRLGIK